jgi:quercetin dioxygenase-like cupin family protein
MSKFFKKVGEQNFKIPVFKDGTKVDGVEFSIPACGEKIMLTKMILNGDVPAHAHDNEQVGVVLSGKMELRVGDESEILTAGDGYFVPGGMTHSVKIFEKTEVIDTFSPPRDEYRD